MNPLRESIPEQLIGRGVWGEGVGGVGGRGKIIHSNPPSDYRIAIILILFDSRRRLRWLRWRVAAPRRHLAVGPRTTTAITAQESFHESQIQLKYGRENQSNRQRKADTHIHIFI